MNFIEVHCTHITHAQNAQQLSKTYLENLGM